MVTIVGAGLGKISLVSQNSLDKIKNAQLVIATDRLYEKFHTLNKNCISLPLNEIADKIRLEKGLVEVVVLASGDIGFYSISKMLKASLQDEFELEFISGTSSLQYLTAKLRLSYENLKTVSLHGREQSAIPFVCYNERVFFLTGGKYKAHDVIDDLVSSGLGDAFVTVGENLSDNAERILTGTAHELQGIEFDNLSVMLVENNRYQACHKTLRDEDFIRGRVPMTKEAVRNLSMCCLEIAPTDIVYDIGAGTGSLSVAMAYKACEGFVYAIEKNSEAIRLIMQNKMRLKAFNLVEICALAPDGISELPSPDKAFIGGSGGNLESIFEILYQKNSKVKIVVNAITLETLHEAKACFESRAITPAITCINVAVSEKIGGYSMMKSQNPVYIICG